MSMLVMGDFLNIGGRHHSIFPRAVYSASHPTLESNVSQLVEHQILHKTPYIFKLKGMMFFNDLNIVDLVAFLEADIAFLSCLETIQRYIMDSALKEGNIRRVIVQNTILDISLFSSMHVHSYAVGKAIMIAVSAGLTLIWDARAVLMGW